MGLVTLRQVGSSQIGDRTCVFCICRRILYHWTTRGALLSNFKYLWFYERMRVLCLPASSHWWRCSARARRKVDQDSGQELGWWPEPPVRLESNSFCPWSGSCDDLYDRGMAYVPVERTCATPCGRERWRKRPGSLTSGLCSRVGRGGILVQSWPTFLPKAQLLSFFFLKKPCLLSTLESS